MDKFADKSSGRRWNDALHIRTPEVNGGRRSIGAQHAALLFILLTMLGCAPMQGPKPEEHNQALALVDQGVVAMRQGDLDAARASFEMARELSPLAAAVDGLGCVELLSGNLLTAEHLFWKAYNMDQSYDNSLGNLALLYEIKGDKVKAEELYKKALAAEPGNFRARSNFSLLMHDYIDGGSKSVGRVDPRVEAELRKVYALAPHPIVAHNMQRLNVEY